MSYLLSMFDFRNRAFNIQSFKKNGVPQQLNVLMHKTYKSIGDNDRHILSLIPISDYHSSDVYFIQITLKREYIKT